MKPDVDLVEPRNDRLEQRVCYLNRGMRWYGATPVFEACRGAWEYQLVLEGGCFPTVDGQPVAQPEGPALWLAHAASRHGWGAVAPEDRSEIRVIHFEGVPDLVERALAGQMMGWVTLAPDEVARLTEEFDAVEACYLGRNDGYARAVFARANWTFALPYLRRYPPPISPAPEGSAQRLVNQAINWMRHHLAENPRVEEAAQAVNVSPTHLRRLFQRVLGATPSRKLIELRMEAAEGLIRRGDRTLAQISDLLGFSEPSAFSRAYHAYFGESPARRRRLRKGSQGER